MRNINNIALGVMGFITLVSSARAEQTKTFMYQFNFEANASFHFTGNTPPLNAALMGRLRNDARQMAETACRGMLGSYDRLERTGLEEVYESILTFNYSVPYTCGKQVLSYSEVAPYLARFVAIEENYILRELARDLLVGIKNESVTPVLKALSTPDYSEEQKIRLIRTLGALLRRETNQDFEVLKLLLNKMNSSSMLAYEAAEAFGNSYRATYFLKQNLNLISHLTLAKAIDGIVNVYKLGSSYEPGIDLVEISLNSLSEEAVAFTVSALTRRGLTEKEMGIILPRLTELANIDKPVHSSVFNVLALEVSGRTADPILRAITPALLVNQKGQTFVFQAMVAMRKFVKLNEAQSILPELREIAASTINPENDYIQSLAKQLITSITQP